MSEQNFAVDIILPDFEGEPCETWTILGEDLQDLVKNVFDAIAGDMVQKDICIDYANCLSDVKIKILSQKLEEKSLHWYKVIESYPRVSPRNQEYKIGSCFGVYHPFKDNCDYDYDRITGKFVLIAMFKYLGKTPAGMNDKEVADWLKCKKAGED